MIEKERFHFIKEKYGLHASWAIWVNEGDTPKSNMGDLSIFEQDKILLKLKPNIIFVGLNISVSGVILNPFENFHGIGGGAYKIRYALKDTILWGAYMTDIIKDFPEIESGNVMNYLRENPSVVDKNIVSFKEELKDVGASNPTIIGFGNHSHNILKKNLGPEFKNIHKVMHYSHYISKKKYRENVIQFIQGLE
jgi:hypothetical protein